MRRGAALGGGGLVLLAALLLWIGARAFATEPDGLGFEVFAYIIAMVLMAAGVVALVGAAVVFRGGLSVPDTASGATTAGDGGVGGRAKTVAVWSAALLGCTVVAALLSIPIAKEVYPAAVLMLMVAPVFALTSVVAALLALVPRRGPKETS